MSIKKLVVKEFTVEIGEEVQCFELGSKYTHFFDPETGKYYQPKSTFQVTGENLENLFDEITDFFEEDE